MTISFAAPEIGCADHDYDGWLHILTEASVRLDADTRGRKAR
jgi:hypothetical protein